MSEHKYYTKFYFTINFSISTLSPKKFSTKWYHTVKS